MCQSSPCLNGGSCKNSIGSYSCRCPANYEGPNCESYCKSFLKANRVQSESKNGFDRSACSNYCIDIEGDVDISLLGKGGCRGGGWQSPEWPKVKGFTTIDNCGRLCVATKGCSAFHAASQKEGSATEFECFLFGHKSVIPAAGLTGDCYTVSKGSVGSSNMVKTKRTQKQTKEKKKSYKIPEFEEPKI